MHGWSALLLALGAVALGFGVLSLVLLLFGAPPDPAWLWGNLVVGVLLIGGALLSNVDDLRERMHSGEARRAGKYGTSAVLSTLFGLVILGLLGFLANRSSVRVDWTEAGVHSLSDQTEKVLGGLERDVEVVAFYSPLEAPRVRPLLDRYAYASDRFKVEYADPTARPDLVETHGIAREKLAGGILRVAIGAESTLLDEVDEERLTNALVKLTRTAEKAVYFLTGHNERPVEGDAADGEGGFGRAAEALRNENYDVKPLILSAVGDVPEDADALIIAGATRPLLPEEHRGLARYVERGGSLMVMIDPGAKTDLYDELRDWGVELGEDIVIDQVQGLFGRAASPLAAQYADHPITRDLREVTLFHVARSVRPRDGAASAFEEIVRTSENSWAETNLEGGPSLDANDVRGPVPIALAGSPPRPESGDQAGGDGQARLVVFGDSDFATNELIDAYRNRDLFINSVNWLIGDVEAISIRPNLSRASRFQLTSEQFSRIRYLSLFVIPESLAVLGALTWWLRRRAPGR